MNRDAAFYGKDWIINEGPYRDYDKQPTPKELVKHEILCRLTKADELIFRKFPMETVNAPGASIASVEPFARVK